MNLPFLRTAEPVRRVTVLRQLGGIGDILMLTPVFRGLKEKYGRDCQVTVATSWAYKSGCLPMLFRGNPHIDRIARVEPNEWASPWLRSNRWEFRGALNDPVPECVRDTDLLMDLNVICAITETRQQSEPGNVRTHRTDIWCEAAGVSPSDKRPVLVLTPEERAEGKRWADEHVGEGCRVGVVLKAHSPVRTWPHTESFTRELLKGGCRVVTIDTTGQYTGIPALVGKNIRQVAAVIGELDAVIAPDSGLLHVAGAMGTPVVGLFGSTDGRVRMREYAGTYTRAEALVPCAPCWYRLPCLQSRDENDHLICMKRITPEMVRFELDEMLTRMGKREKG